MEIPAEFPPATAVRIRRRPRQFDYESQGEPIVESREKFRIEFYTYVLDIAINAMDERFEQLSALNADFFIV